MRLVPCLVLLSLSASLWCEDAKLKPAAEPAATNAPADAAAVRKAADTQAAVGMQAMRDADADPHRGVDAALAFSSAMHGYEQVNDVDAVCEMQANIFWCKKRMNLDNLQDYVAKKGGSAESDLARAQMVMTKEVPVEEATAYFDRAVKFQEGNADKHLLVAVRFSEVIERFPDTDAAKKASAIFAKEQTAYMTQVSEERKKEQEQLKAELNQVRKSRFMQPPPVIEGTAMAVPDKAAQDKALGVLKKAYKDDYAKKKDSQKRAFAKKLVADAANSKDDAALYYVMLDESTRLAMESEDYETLLSSIEKAGSTFQGYDVTAHKRATLTAMKSKTTSTLILKLMDDPTDKAANTAVGRFFCFNISRWDLGLPMLSLGADPDMHAVAEMEISVPKDVAEQKQTADAWYNLGKKAPSADKIPMWSRAQFWYAQAQPKLAGVNKQMVEKNMDDIDKVLPAVITDFENITPKQWDKLKGTLLTIEARIDRSDGNIALVPGQRIRVVPHPTDEWKFNDGSDDFSTNYKGLVPRRSTNGGGGGSGMSSGFGYYGRGKFAQAALVCKVGESDEIAPGIITGKGHLWIMPHNTWGSLGTGTIRVKLVAVTDDD